MPRKTAAKPLPAPEPARHAFRESDALFVQNLRDAADAMVAAGMVEPGWPTFVRIAASELERTWRPAP